VSDTVIKGTGSSTTIDYSQFVSCTQTCNNGVIVTSDGIATISQPTCKQCGSNTFFRVQTVSSNSNLPTNVAIGDILSPILDIEYGYIDSLQHFHPLPLPSDLTICISTGTPVKKSYTDGNACLGYIASSANQWKCEDPCLKKSTSVNGTEQLCGKTSHLTSFAILLSGGSHRIAGSKNGCTSSRIVYNTITGNQLGDIGLFLGVIGILWCVIIPAVVFFFQCTNRGRSIFRGSRAVDKRASKVRISRESMQSVDVRGNIEEVEL